MAIAIDFTSSNGDPKSSESLHCNDPFKNQYVQAINSLGKVIQHYDQDGKLPLFGFGGQLSWCMPDKNIAASHCFALNGDIFNPEVDGVTEAVSTYLNSLDKVKLCGPTYFNQIIDFVKDFSANFHLTHKLNDTDDTE